MSTLDDLKATLIRTPDAMPVLVRVNSGADETTYELLTVDMRAALLAGSDERIAHVLGQPPNTLWITHPSGQNQPEIAQTTTNLMHGLLEVGNAQTPPVVDVEMVV